MVSCMVEERTDKMESFVVGDMRRWFLTAWLAVRILGLNVSGHVKTFGVTEAYMGEVGLDDDRSDSGRDRNGG